MTIYANTFTITGAAYNMPVYTNTLGMNGYSNMAINSDLFVEGDVYTSGRLDVGTTLHATFRLTSNVDFTASNVFSDTSNVFQLDFLTTNFSNMSNMPLVVPMSNIYDAQTGIITIPMNGMYNLEIQGSFSNDDLTQNGVWYKFLDSPYPDVRVAAQVNNASMVYSGHMTFLQGGSRILPQFYSSSSNTILVADANETYIGFTLAASYDTGTPPPAPPAPAPIT
jgi:hypothetical protein